MADTKASLDAVTASLEADDATIDENLDLAGAEDAAVPEDEGAAGPADDGGDADGAPDEGAAEASAPDPALPKPPPEHQAAPRGKKPAKGEGDLYREPAGLSDEAKGRFKKLVDGHRELQQRYTSEVGGYKQRVDAFTTLVRESGAAPQEFAELIRYSSLVKSGTREGAVAALKILDQHREVLARSLGLQVPGVDLLADTPDLAEKVKTMEMTQDAAVELATLRRQQQVMAAAQQQAGESQAAAAQYNAYREKAVVDLNALEQGWIAHDPDYAAKRDMILEAVHTIVCTVHPANWVNAAKVEYERINAVVARFGVANNRAGGGRSGQPMRPSGGRGVDAPNVKTSLDEVTRVLGMGW